MSGENQRAERIARFMVKKVNKAVYEFGMIKENDRIAVGLSGGKDSLVLLEMLIYRQLSAPEKYEVVAIHVVGDARGPGLPPYVELEDWLRKKGIQYDFRPIHLAADEVLPMTCERCIWNRRRTLFEMASDLKCNKVALGHHLDDFAETALLNLIHHGRLETMTPSATYFDGTFELIRPLLYIPKTEIERYAVTRDFPPPPPKCPRSADTQRQRMKELIAEMSKEAKNVRQNLVRAALATHSSKENH